MVEPSQEAVCNIMDTTRSAADPAATKEAFAALFADDPLWLRRATVLSAEAADVYGEMWGEQMVGLHLTLMTCLDNAVVFGDALARRRDLSPAELQRTARAVGGSLQVAAKTMKVMQDGPLMLAHVRATGSPQDLRPRGDRTPVHDMSAGQGVADATVLLPAGTSEGGGSCNAWANSALASRERLHSAASH
jgi:hypothetical protein